jgi:Rod binding domain-containing protein
MANGIALTMPGLTGLDALGVANSKAPKPGTLAHDKAKATAQDFEAAFLNSMFQQMFTDVSGEGPFGGSGGTGMWRSFLTDEYAKGFAKAGGIGLSDTVYRELISKQGMSS